MGRHAFGPGEGGSPPQPGPTPGGTASRAGAERLTESEAMALALELAGRGVRGANPLVGAVVLGSDGAVLGTGYHRGAGTAHAEAAALAATRAAGRDTSGATMVVTLEPCNHTGRTGPCSEAVLAAGISRLVYAAADPTADAAGGAARLASAGVDVEAGLMASDAADLNHRWSAAARQRRPFITLKTAQSVDGRAAAADGTSQWITGPEARAYGHAIRARADAVLAGTGTVLADNPRLTARTPEREEADAQPLRVVLGTRQVPAGAAVRGTDGRFLQLAHRDPARAARELYDAGVRHLLIEGGPAVAGAFLAGDLVDELVCCTAPVLLGHGLPALALEVPTLAAARRWRWDTRAGGAVTAAGPDLVLRLEPIPAGDAAETKTTPALGTTTPRQT
ncbi:Riboflavin biosynthesis protein RibD [Arthrobacter saudimassiliensis]|uniref:Riboflavin biosynthesis protein RibD n=1 Tax=Arthrobacter saudimassiliensis TaxID=1461584 RepID=A0A078MKW4_9MICC|nr:Riboflavin biosynthesis protein RibD [Arthrobacter saudimassiliensis]